VATEESAAEVRANVLAAMPQSLGELYLSLRDELTWIHLKWIDFLGLFGKKECVETLNEVAPALFAHLQRALWEDVLLHLCRLTDPPQSMGHDNLTFRRLPPVVSDPTLQAKVKGFVDAAVAGTQFARDWRNRRLAHKELPPADGSPSKPLATASRKHVEEALLPMREAMNAIQLQFMGSATGYEHSIGALGGVDSLLFYVGRGLKAVHEERENRLPK
jgi:hypothetical protein